MAEQAASATLAGAALTMAMVEAGMPLAVGFATVGILGACVGHARWTIELERKDPAAPALPWRLHLCMLGRGLLMAQFVCLILLLMWLEYHWPWTFGLIAASLGSVFASDAIEWMWQRGLALAGRVLGDKAQ